MAERAINIIKESIRILCHKNNINISEHDAYSMAKDYYSELYKRDDCGIEKFVEDYIKGIKK